MTGLPGLNYAAFDAAKARAISAGHEVVSPADIGRETGFMGDESQAITPIELLGIASRDLEALMSCHAIVLLPGWERSKGARAEKAVAEWIGLSVLDAVDFQILTAIASAQARVPPRASG